MAQNFIACDRGQAMLMPPDLLDWVPDDHVVWSILGAVEQMDLTAFYGAYRENGQGRAAYEPSMMVALLLYAYARGNRSSRGIERGCREDVVYKLITAMRVPDHSTIAEFRRRHERAIAELFSAVLELCEEAGLVEVGIIAIDGTKIRANASRGANRTYEKLVADILKEAEETDRWEDGLFGADRGDELPEHLRTEEGRRQAFKAAKERLARKAGRGEEPEVAQFELDMEQFTRVAGVGVRGIARAARRCCAARTGRAADRRAHGPSGCLSRCIAWRKTIRSRCRPTPRMRRGGRRGPLVACPARNSGCHRSRSRPRRSRTGVMNKTDHDSRMMRTQGQPTVQGYNAQAAVTRGQIIVAAEITVESPDFGHLEPVVNAALRELEDAGVTQRPEIVLADAGYWHTRADGEHRQRRHPGARAARRWTAERHQARLGQRHVCVHAPGARQRARPRRSTSTENRRSSRCSRRSSSTARSTDSNAEAAPRALSEWRLVAADAQPDEAPQPLDRRRNRLTGSAQIAGSDLHSNVTVNRIRHVTNFARQPPPNAGLGRTYSDERRQSARVNYFSA